MLGGEHLYVFQMAVTGDVKVGRSSNIPQRMAQVQTGCPHKLRVILKGEGLGHQEREIHRRLRRYRCRMSKGEWFSEDCLGELPVEIYNLIPLEVLEDPDWWRR